MSLVTWDALAEQLRSLGIDVPVIQPIGAELCEAGTSAEDQPSLRQTMPIAAATPLQQSESPTDSENADPDELARVLAGARAAGVGFFQNVTTGEVVIDRPVDLNPDLRRS